MKVKDIKTPFERRMADAKRQEKYRKAAVAACRAAGIPTEALEAGVVKEMVEALNKASDNANYKGEKAIIPLDDLFRLREVLAKLGIKE